MGVLLLSKLNFETLLDSGEVLPADAKELRSVLSNKSVQRALGSILTLAEGMDRLSACDLDGREGLNVALRQKGTVEGMRLAVDAFIDLAEEDDNEHG